MGETAGTFAPELQAFVTTLRQDGDPVVAALALPYRQGQIEGRVNRLKLIEGSMDGGAKFDLSRQWVLYASTSSSLGESPSGHIIPGRATEPGELHNFSHRLIPTPHCLFSQSPVVRLLAEMRMTCYLDRGEACPDFSWVGQ